MQEVNVKRHYNNHLDMVEWCVAILGKRTGIWGELPTRAMKWSYLRSPDWIVFRFYYEKDATLFKLTWL
jgi:hypothetical protein